MVALGDATGFAIAGLFNPEAGDHEYEIPVPAFNAVLFPAQREISDPAVAVGVGNTVRV